MSHSAGAAHAGSYAYDPLFSSAGESPLAGLIVVSGRVRIDNLAENPNAKKVEEYYGTDKSRFEAYSPVHHVNNRGRGKAANTSSKAVFPVSVISPQASYRSRRNRNRMGANHGNGNWD